MLDYVVSALRESVSVKNVFVVEKSRRGTAIRLSRAG